MPLELCADDQPVESVVLRLAIPDADERLLKFRLDRLQVVLHAHRRETEIADAHRALSTERLDFVWDFGLYLQPHVLQPRHDLRKWNGRAGVNDLEVELPLLLPAMAVQIGDQL